MRAQKRTQAGGGAPPANSPCACAERAVPPRMNILTARQCGKTKTVPGSSSAGTRNTTVRGLRGKPRGIGKRKPTNNRAFRRNRSPLRPLGRRGFHTFKRDKERGEASGAPRANTQPKNPRPTTSPGEKRKPVGRSAQGEERGASTPAGRAQQHAKM